MGKTLEDLKNLLKRKRSVSWYADKLGWSIDEVEKGISDLRGNTKPEGQILIERIDELTGEKVVEYSSSRPLSTEELKALCGHDGVTTIMTMSWLKSHKSGVWTYSMKMAYPIQGFTNIEQVKQKFNEIFPLNLEKYKAPKVTPTTNKVAIVVISDDHCGLVLKNSQYGNEQSEKIYRERLNQVLETLYETGEVFSEILLVSLGDELDGFNGYTTRGGHHLGSEDNRSQFDMFVNSRKIFYDKLFQSGLADKYVLLNHLISNHSGNGLSYMAHRALEIYIENVYEGVSIIHADKTIHTYEIGNHVFGFVHGKDEKHQKTPMPLVLNDKTDNYLFEFYDKLGYSPSRNWIHLIKADIHKFGIQQGKFGRYVNCPSISSGSNWIEANFGNSKPGALIEIVNPNKECISTIPVWFK